MSDAPDPKAIAAAAAKAAEKAAAKALTEARERFRQNPVQATRDAYGVAKVAARLLGINLPNKLPFL